MPTEEELQQQQQSQFTPEEPENSYTYNDPENDIAFSTSGPTANIYPSEESYQQNAQANSYRPNVLNSYNSPDIASLTGGNPWGPGSRTYDRFIQPIKNNELIPKPRVLFNYFNGGIRKTYIVKPGDSPWRIAHNEKISMNDLAEWNPTIFPQGLKDNTYKLHPGMVLYVAPPISLVKKKTIQPLSAALTKELERRLFMARLAYNQTGGDSQYLKIGDKYQFGTIEKATQADFLHGGYYEPGRNQKDYNIRINTNYRYVISREGEEKIGTENQLLNLLLGNFFHGWGAENTVFPTDGKFSSMLKNKRIITTAYQAYIKKNEIEPTLLDGFEYEYGFGGLEMWKSLVINADLTSIEQFLGSGSVKFTKLNNNKYLVTVFNITSITSGDLTADKITFGRQIPSLVRNPEFDSPQLPYTNNSQTFSFTIDLH